MLHDFFVETDEYIWKALEEIKEGKIKHRWLVVPKSKLIYFYTLKREPSDQELYEWNKILDRLFKNTAKLNAFTQLCGHDEVYPIDDILEFFEDDDAFIQASMEYFTDENGGWRISDYAIPTLLYYLGAMFETTDFNVQRMNVNLFLSVAHMRSDLASWFVEGGFDTLDEIKEM